jgi:hypothetical protein
MKKEIAIIVDHQAVPHYLNHVSVRPSPHKFNRQYFYHTYQNYG